MGDVVVRLRSSLAGLLAAHVALVECGDCGFSDADGLPEVVAARAALALDVEAPEVTGLEVRGG